MSSRPPGTSRLRRRCTRLVAAARGSHAAAGPLRRIVLGGALALLLASGAAAGAPEPLAILAEADRARGNPEGVSWEVSLEASGDGESAAMVLEVRARGFDYLARVTAPPKIRGQALLMRGGNLWFHKPDLSKPVPLSQRQKLLGDAAYGDIAATDYAADYAIDGVAEEPLEGEPCLRFELRARTGRATYDRLRYWVSLERRVGLKAEYFTRGGRLLKSARMEYGNTVLEAGGRRRAFISRMVISDEIQRGRGTVMIFSRPALQAVSPRTFDVNLMGR